MSQLERIEAALRNAHAAGDVRAARSLADYYIRVRDQQAQLPASPRAAPQGPVADDDGGGSFVDRLASGARAVDAGVRNLARGMTMGYADEIAAGGDAVVGEIAELFGAAPAQSIGDRYAEALSSQRAQDDANDEDYGLAFQLATQGLGAAATGGVGLARAGLAQGATLAGRLAQGAAGGAGIGAVAGFGEGRGGFDNRVESGLYGGAAGALLGTAGGALSGAAARRANSQARRGAERAIQKDAPTTEELKAQAGRIFDTIDAEAKPEVVGAIRDGLFAKLRDEGFSPRLHPKLAGALDDLGEAATDPAKAESVRTLRRIIQGAAKSTDPDEARLGKIATNAFDDALGDMTEDQLRSGSIESLRQLPTANAIYARAKKSELIDEVFRKAELQPSGYENGLRIGFRALLNNRALRRRFSEEEIAAMQKIVEGDFTANTLRKLSRLGFGAGQQTTGLGGQTAAGLGALVGSTFGPAGTFVGATAPAAVGRASSAALHRTQAQRAELVRALAATGRTPAVPYNPTAGLEVMRAGQAGASPLAEMLSRR